MKRVLLMTTAVVAIAGAAQAEVSFVKGTASLSYSAIVAEDFSIIDGGAAAAFSTGTYGFQFGGDSTTYTDFTESVSFGAADAHVYHQGASGDKYGVYANSGALGYIGGLGYGVEGMFGFGPMDVEVFAGLISVEGDSLGEIGIEVFYGVTSNIEISAAYLTMFVTDGGTWSEDFYSVGLSYDIPDTSIAVTGSYDYFDNGLGEMYGIGLEWNFGPDQGERLFSDRTIPFFFGA
jgi:hypothetical protein